MIVFPFLVLIYQIIMAVNLFLNIDESQKLISENHKLEFYQNLYFTELRMMTMILFGPSMVLLEL